MAYNLGKKFEEQFKKDFSKIEDSSIDRIMDVMSGYKYISGISDFICYIYPNIFYIELKTHKGNTFPLDNLTQYDKLRFKVGIKGVRVGVVIWFQDHDTVVYVPISEITKMIKDGKRSVNIKYLYSQEYKMYLIPSQKKRTFMDSDYSILKELKEGE